MPGEQWALCRDEKRRSAIEEALEMDDLVIAAAVANLPKLLGPRPPRRP